jgi:glucan biosynthesis protein C
MASLLLRISILIPVLYYGALAVGGYLTPGYDHMTMLASELGIAGKPAAQLFNYALIATGGIAVLSGIGVLFGVRALKGSILWALLAAVGIVAWGAAVIYAGLYPMPDPRHMGPVSWQGLTLGLAAVPAALFLFLGLSGRSDMGGVKVLLILSFLAMIAFNLIFANVGGLDLVKPEQQGLWQRAFSLSMVPWIGIAPLCIAQAMSRRARRSRDPMREVIFSDDVVV